LQEADNATSSDFTVIVTTPAFNVETKPLGLTVAIASSEELQITFLLVASSGVIVATNAVVSPFFSVRLLSLILIPLTVTIQRM
jgi:hypothetical protein